jgi:IMP cyclohydrolase
MDKVVAETIETMNNEESLWFAHNVGLKTLRSNPYSGRGIILGTNFTGTHAVQVYWISGRSAGSRNRCFEQTTPNTVKVVIADPSKEKGVAALTLYTAMRHENHCFIVSNGNQTDTVAQHLSMNHRTLAANLEDVTYEPDAPNFTCRITGVTTPVARMPLHELALLRRPLRPTDEAERFFYQYNDSTPGIGHCITTYAGDALLNGGRLPPFFGEPITVPLPTTGEEILDLYWDAINHDHRVSIAVRMIEKKAMQSRILMLNAYQKINATAPDNAFVA